VVVEKTVEKLNDFSIRMMRRIVVVEKTAKRLSKKA